MRKFIQTLNFDFAEGKISGVEYNTTLRNFINLNKDKKDQIERFVILDLYQFQYGHPQPVTLNLLTDIPIDTNRNILSTNEEYSKFQKPKKQKLFRRVKAFDVDQVLHLDFIDFT